MSPADHRPAVPGSPRPLPVTLLGGLHGPAPARAPEAGRATVDVHLLPGATSLRLVSVDAAGKVTEHEVDVRHGCLSCTLREVLPPVLSGLAARRRTRAVRLTLPPAVEPAGVARMLSAPAVVGSLARTIRVESVVAVVSPPLLLRDLSGDTLLAERGLVPAGDRRNTAEVLARQVETADVVVLATTADPLTRALVRHLNPRAEIAGVDPAGVPVLPAGRADGGPPPWLDATTLPAPPPAGDGVATVLWQAARPLHPGRLQDALRPLVGLALRSRGHVWLANRPTQQVAWESAGESAALGTLGSWLDSASLAGSEIRLVGPDLRIEQVHDLLDACVLSDVEMAAGPSAWRRLDDPFRDVLGDEPPVLLQPPGSAS